MYKLMCGITGIYNSYEVQKNSTIQYRGPDESVFHRGNVMTLLFDRLSINGVSNGTQPFVKKDRQFICNGEIYNHIKLKESWGIECDTDSDCEVVFDALCNNELCCADILRSIDGVFALIYEDANGRVIAARDPIGIRPLYVAYDETDGVIGFSSEAKGFTTLLHPNVITKVVQFPPGHYYDSSEQQFIRYTDVVPEYITDIKSLQKSDDIDFMISHIHDLLYSAVEKRLMSERPVAFFLSGGLDSSIIAAIGAKIMHPQQITCFSIGTDDGLSPDVQAAKTVAKHLNAIHHIYNFKPEDAFREIKNTIWHLESYDCTTVRASVPMFMLSKYINAHFDFKVILSGEGADELFGGYLYLHNAPNDLAFHNETLRLIKDVHQFDALRADRCTAGNGLELRVPFFDLQLVRYVTNIHPSFKVPHQSNLIKTKLEKLILRLSFTSYLPEEIILRQKNGMSDAVGYAWVDFVRNNAREMLESDKMEDINIEVNTPLSEEEHLYRLLFSNHFKDFAVTSHDGIWRPKWTTITDPSARQLNDIFQE